MGETKKGRPVSPFLLSLLGNLETFIADQDRRFG